MTSLAPPLHALVLAPQPEGTDLRWPRRAAAALYDALEAQGDQIQAEYLWPATADALSARLAGQPRIDIVLLAGVPLRDGEAVVLEECDGQPAALPFGALGSLLAEAGVSLAIVVLADSAADAPEIAAALADAGLPVALQAVGLPPRALDQAIGSFLAGVLVGRAPSRALDDARQAMSEQHATGLALACTADEPLLAAGINQPAEPKIIRFPGPDLLPAWQRLPTLPKAGGLPAEPEPAFVGRHDELARLERALRAFEVPGPVVLHGPEGVGKTALAAHIGRWLVRSGRFQAVAYTSLAGGGHADAVLSDLAAIVLGERTGPVAGELVDAVTSALAERPTLVIWDHLDAVGNASDYALSDEARQALAALAERLLAVAGTALLLVATREQEARDLIPALAPAFSLAVQGLPAEDAAELLRGLTSDRDHSALTGEEAARLTAALDGHPLALAVAAALLSDRSPAELLAALERVLPGITAGEGPLRDQAMATLFEALWRDLDTEAQQTAMRMGIFSAGFMQALGTSLIKAPEEVWERLKALLVRARLWQAEELPGLTVPYLRFHPVLGQSLSRRLAGPARKELAEAHASAYMGLLGWIAQNEGRAPEVMRTLGRRELPNLRRALPALLAQGEIDRALEVSRALMRLLDQLGYRAERDEVNQTMRQAISRSVPREGPLDKAGVQILLKQAEALMATGRVSEGSAALYQLATRVESPQGLSYSGLEAARDRAMVLRRLARNSILHRRPDQAVEQYTRAASHLRGGLLNDEAKRDLAVTHQELAEAYRLSTRLREAYDALSQSHALAEELNDAHLLASTSAQMGALAAARREPDQAREHLNAALGYMDQIGDHAGKAAVWSQLAMLAWRGDDLEEAERAYLQSLAEVEQAEHHSLQAQAHMQLAHLAQLRQRVDDAEAHYGRAIALYQEARAKPAQAAAEMALAELLLQRERVDQARAHAEAARAILEGGGAEAQPWLAHELLRRVATAEGDPERALQWRRRAIETYRVSPHAERMLAQWNSVIDSVAGACRGEALADGAVRLLDMLGDKEQWRALVDAIWRILQGERGPELYADLDYVDATVVHRILEAIETPEPESENEESREN